MKYRPRVLDDLLARRLRSSGAVLIEGPKACGKTSTARQHSRSEVLLDVDQNAREQLKLTPELVLDREPPMLVDEWQLEATTVWNHVRRLVDARGASGQFILTGSAVPDDDATRHTGAGRFSTLQMRPMSLFETGRYDAQVSLRELLSGQAPRTTVPARTIPEILELVCVGGWPSNAGRTLEDALAANRAYLNQTVNVDVHRLGSSRGRDPLKLDRVVRSLARSTASDASISTIARDAAGPDGQVHRETVTAYLDALERLKIVEDQPAWNTHLRSSATLRKAPKRHFIDPSMAVAALRTSPQALLADLSTAGHLFESMVMRDLRVLSDPLEGTVTHYQDSYQAEADAIVSLPDGTWAAFEVKLGAVKADEGAASLKRFLSNVDTTRSGEPAALVVITGDGEYAYQRPDGISVVPIATLRP